MEIFQFSKDGIFNGDVNDTCTFEKNTYTNEDVAMRLLPAMYGLTIANVTYGQLNTITRMINNGWTLMPSFFKEVDHDGNEFVTPNFGCFMMWCDIKGEVVQYICSINYTTNEVELYTYNKKLADYPSIDAMFECMPQLTDTEPLKCVEYNDSFVSKNVTSFDVYGFDSEIYLEDNYVFGDMDSSRCEFFLDKSRCHEIIFERGE